MPAAFFTYMMLATNKSKSKLNGNKEKQNDHIHMQIYYKETKKLLYKNVKPRHKNSKDYDQRCLTNTSVRREGILKI